jgi:biotin transport system substrate-specific component
MTDITKDTTEALPAPAVARSSVATDIALIATFAAFIAVCAILPGIPTGSGVPITLQTFGVILSGLVLGWRRGALAVLLYLAVGLAGVPIFADATGGLGVLGKASAGYLLAFPLGAALAGLLATPAAKSIGWSRYTVLFTAGVFGSFLTIHVGGIIGLMARLDIDLGAAVAIDVVYLPGDIIKNAAAAAVAYTLFRAYPDLLRNRR